VTELPDLRDFVRSEPLPPSATLIVRGGPDSVAKLAAHAERLRRAFVLDGAPVLGISVFAASDDIGPASCDGIAAGKLSTYRVRHRVPVGKVTAAGFPLLPTFERPHMTLVLASLDRVAVLVDLLGPAEPNPQYGELTRRRRRRPR
jgi:hypothetical protein